MVKNLESKLIDDVVKILGPNGLLANETGNMSHHQDQLDFAIRTAKGFCRFDENAKKTSINMLQASTGTGKTIAYLVPLMLYSAHTGERVAVSTHTRQLQKQIIDSDGVFVQAWVQKITGQKISLAKRVGISNYVSLSSCENLLHILQKEDRPIFNDAIDFLEGLLFWLEEEEGDSRKNTGIFDDFLADKNITSIPYGVKQSMLALDRSSPEDELSLYQNDVEQSKLVDLVVVNHALLIRNAFRFASLLDGQDEREMKVLVCDEADQLEGAAENMLSAELPLHKLSKVVNDYAKFFNHPSIVNKVKSFHDYVMKIKPPDKNILSVTDNSEFGNYVEQAKDSLLKVEKEVSGLLIKGDLFKDELKTAHLLEFVDVVNDLNEFCKTIKSSENSAIVSWSPVREYPTLRISNTNPGRVLGRLWSLRLWDQEKHGVFDEDLLEKRSYLKAALFTSATITTPSRIVEKSFDDFSSTIGIIRHKSLSDGMPIHHVQTDLLQIYEPKKFGKMHFVLADPSAPSPTSKVFYDDTQTYISDPQWLDYCALVIIAAHNAGKRTLVLTLSFKDSQELAKRLAHLPNLIVHKQGEPINYSLREFDANERAILMSPSAWEGLNRPGMINNLVITRIPFTPVDAISFEMLRIQLNKKGMSEDKIKNISYAKSISAARRKLSQGLGRPIRQTDDEATIWFADPRFPLPDNYHGSLDPVLMSGIIRNNISAINTVIPKRFIETGYNQAKLCLIDGSVYTPLNFGE